MEKERKKKDCMNKRSSPVISLLFCFFLLLSFSACHKDDDTIETFQGKTVLVYMVADNSLSSEANINIDSLEAGLSRDTVNGNLLVYVDQLNDVPKLIQLVKPDNGTVRQQVVKAYKEQNSVSPTVMASVLKDVTDCFPSTSYGLVLWSHGYGWLPATSTSKAITSASARAVSLRWFGLDGTDEMSLPDLVTALSAGPHFDYILFDACFMGGVETAYALRGCTNYVIASPAEVLADGFPYKKLVPSLFGSTESDYIRIASLFYDYYNSQSGYRHSAAISCVKCSELENLAVEEKVLIDVHVDDLNTFDAASVQAMDSYTPHLFYDLGHFVECFTTEQERTSFENQLSKTVVYQACTPNILSVGSSGYTGFFPVNHFSGLNTYLPPSGNATLNTSYQTMEWYSAVGWGKTKW
jgi:hypothetical protein